MYRRSQTEPDPLSSNRLLLATSNGHPATVANFEQPLFPRWIVSFLARKIFLSKHLASFFIHLSRRIKRKATLPTVFPTYLLPKSGKHGKVCAIYSQLACNTRLIRSVLHQNRVTGELSQFLHRVISTLYFLHRSATVAFKRLSFASTFLSQTGVAAIDIFRWTANSLSQHERKAGVGWEGRKYCCYMCRRANVCLLISLTEKTTV